MGPVVGPAEPQSRVWKQSPKSFPTLCEVVWVQYCTSVTCYVKNGGMFVKTLGIHGQKNTDARDAHF